MALALSERRHYGNLNKPPPNCIGHKCQSSTRRYAELAKVEALRIMHQPRANRLQLKKSKDK